MVAKEVSRLALFLAEWVLSVVCLGLFPSSLYRTTKDEARRKICSIGSVSFCRFGVVWTLLGVLILTAVILWHLEEYCTRFALPPLVELLFVAFLLVWWVIAAVSFTVAKTNVDIVDATSAARKVLRVSAWALVILFGVSAFVTWRIARVEDAVVDNAFNVHDGGMQFEETQYQAGYRSYGV